MSPFHAAPAAPAPVDSERAPAGGDGRAGGGDPVGTAERLRVEVAGRLSDIVGFDVAEAAPVGEPDDVYVGWFAALDARTCPTRYQWQGEEGWGFPGWSAATAGGAIGRASLARHLDAHEPEGYAPTPAPCPEPLAAVRAWMRAMRTVPDSAVGDWVADRAAHGDDVTLAAAAAGATRWMAGFVRVLGWPLPDRLRLLGTGRRTGDRPLRWPAARRSAVTVASGADARIGRVRGSGDFAIVVHRPSGGEDGRVRDRAAFEATAAALAIGIVPASVLVTAGDTGERLRVAVDTDLLHSGVELVAGAVRHRHVATRQGPDPTAALPSPACRHCPVLDRCDPGRTWLAGPGRWRGGLPVL